MQHNLLIDSVFWETLFVIVILLNNFKIAIILLVFVRLLLTIILETLKTFKAEKTQYPNFAG
jgi:ABC-type transport system involved in cytochrome bd biosynthesis fused ATPase/permease subunit